MQTAEIKFGKRSEQAGVLGSVDDIMQQVAEHKGLRNHRRLGQSQLWLGGR